MHDLIIKGGRVIDPSQGLDGLADVSISQGRIRALASTLRGEAARVVDAQGKLVTPGLIDLHTHVYQGVTQLGLPPDKMGVEVGVTTVVDTGSAGPATFQGMKQFVIPSARSRVFCLLHIARTGLCHIPEIRDWQDVDWDGTVAVARANRDIIKGIKVRITQPMFTLGSELVKMAKRIAREAGLPLMVHPCYQDGYEVSTQTAEILRTLEKGDIVTHFLTPKLGGVLRSPERVALVKDAMARGVVLDVARGNGNFNFTYEVARRALAQGILPSTLSTDVTTKSFPDPTVRLTVIMSQFLALGLDLPQVVAMTTINPARALGEEEHLGSLKVGMPADLSILEALEGDWPFTDPQGETIRGRVRLEPRLVVREGQVHPVAASR